MKDKLQEVIGIIDKSIFRPDWMWSIKYSLEYCLKNNCESAFNREYKLFFILLKELENEKKSEIK